MEKRSEAEKGICHYKDPRRNKSNHRIQIQALYDDTNKKARGAGRRKRKLSSVSIYTYTDIKGLKKKDGSAWYILEVETSKGPATVGDKLHLEQNTENQAELTALLEAVRRLRGECEVHIYTESKFVAAGWIAGWLEGWKEKGWKTRKGEPVAFCEMWKEIDQIISSHPMQIHVKEHHSYSGWFEFEARRGKEKKSCTRDSENSIQQRK